MISFLTQSAYKICRSINICKNCLATNDLSLFFSTAVLCTGGNAKISTPAVITRDPLSPCSRSKMETALVATQRLSGLKLEIMKKMKMLCYSTYLKKFSYQTADQGKRFLEDIHLDLALVSMHYKFLSHLTVKESAVQIQLANAMKSKMKDQGTGLLNKKDRGSQ